MAQTKRLTLAPDSGDITPSILVLRSQRVLLDAGLAILYGVATRTLVQAVQRNRARFPADFMFQLSAVEWRALRSQFVISKGGRGGRRYPPYAFTEQGVAMLSSVLASERAIAVNIEIMRAFVRMRELLSSNKALARRFAQLEARIDKKLAEHDEAITAILSAIRELMNAPPSKRRGIGFTANIEEKP
jgi:ORF6N domain